MGPPARGLSNYVLRGRALRVNSEGLMGCILIYWNHPEGKGLCCANTSADSFVALLPYVIINESSPC